MTTPPAAPPAKPQGWFARNWLWVVPTGCLSFVLLCVACLAAGIYLLFGAIQKSEPAQEALRRVQASQALVEALGTPIEPGWYITGSTKTSGKTGHAELSMPISGPKGKGTLVLKATLSGGPYWEFSRLYVELEDQRRFDLLRGEMRPAPQAGASS